MIITFFFLLAFTLTASFKFVSGKFNLELASLVAKDDSQNPAHLINLISNDRS